MICPRRLRVFDGPAFACDAGTPEAAGIVRASLQGDVEKTPSLDTSRDGGDEPSGPGEGR
jgi:hypothetical protein